MFNKIILFLALVFSSIFVTENTYALSAKEKLELLRKGEISQELKEVTVEIKLEDEDKEDLNLGVKWIWKSDAWKTYRLKYFSSQWSLQSFTRRIEMNENYGTFQLMNKSWKKVLTKGIEVDLDYNKFNWTKTEKRLLYYIQLKYNHNTESYDLVKIYTELEAKDQEKLKEEKKKAIFKWRIIDLANNRSIFKANVWLYTKEGILIKESVTSTYGEFEIILPDLEIFSLKEEYYLWWYKKWNLDEEIVWIRSGGERLYFNKYSEISDYFWEEKTIKVETNDKDVVKKEDFPYILLVTLLVVYFSFCYYIFITIIKKVLVRPDSKVTIVKSQRREQKIKKIRWE